MTDWLKMITNWIIELIKSILGFIFDLLYDSVVYVLDMIFGVIATLLSSIPVPSFLSGNDLGSLLSGLPSFALYVVGHINLPEAMLIIGAGVAFNLLRKLFTLGQW